MAGWKNNDLVLYHGCTAGSLRPQNDRGISVGGLPHCIDLSIGNPRAEFGRGFYTTTWLHQAKSWANRNAWQHSSGRRGRRATSPTAVVLRFEIKRDDLADLEALVFTNQHSGFWSFVAYCRNGFAPHARLNGRQSDYDIVYGPMSNYPQKMILQDSDQISFHTAKALAIVPSLSVAAVGAPLFDDAMPA